MRAATLLAAFLGVTIATAVAAQAPVPPPPMPGGPPLEQVIPTVHAELVPAPAVRATLSWLEDNADALPGESIVPAAHHCAPDGAQLLRPQHPTPPPSTFAGSACNFNAWCGDNIFSPDFHSTQVLVGSYWSTHLGPKIPAFDYCPITIRKGWMLTAPDDCGYGLQGNWECLCDLTVAPITSEYGTALGGPSFLLRRNFLTTGASVVPYAQCGLGFMLTDAHKNKHQDAIGQAFNFIVNGQLGLRFFVADNLTLDIEGGMQHISNANFASRNAGVNALGGQVGLTYFFPWGGK